MPLPPGGHIQYANLPADAFISGTATLNHGIVPSSITIKAAPTVVAPASVGPVTITYGGLYVRLFCCRLVQIEPRYGGDGSLAHQVLHIVDRRWTWVNRGWVRGLYNFREGSGSFRKQHKKNAQELAKLLFAAMGETTYNVSALPADQFPYCEWDGNPARYLETLCSQFACRVSLNPVNNQARIVRVGQGASLPWDQTIIDDKFDVAPPQRPPKVVFYGGRTLYQQDLELEAVGTEPDTGEIKLIDDLSYKPSAALGGWNACSFDFPKIDPIPKPAIGEATYQDHARADIWKLYRIKVPFPLLYGFTLFQNGKVKVINARDIERLEEILPLENRQIQTRIQKKAPQEQYERIEPWVIGDFDQTIRDYVRGDKFYDCDADGKQYRKYPRGFSVDANRGLVRFGEAVTRIWNETTGQRLKQSDSIKDGTKMTYRAPKLFLRIAFGVRDATDMTWTRYARERDIQNNTTPGTLPYYLRREDVVRRLYRDWSKTPTLQDNEPDLQTIADFYIDQYLASINLVAPVTRRYAGLKLIPIDGTIQQVIWQVDDEGFTTTTASFNQEKLVPELSWQDKRAMQQNVLAFDENSLFTGGTRNSFVSEL